jgi:hypothetical protein
MGMRKRMWESLEMASGICNAAQPDSRGFNSARQVMLPFPLFNDYKKRLQVVTNNGS